MFTARYELNLRIKFRLILANLQMIDHSSHRKGKTNDNKTPNIKT
jgi:hypothetical protein